MAYKLNDILLSVYGITPGRMDGEGIAVSGIFDMPKRIGDTQYSWAESNGVEPYVDADEIFFGGRTIYFKGILIGDKTTVKTFLNAFKTAVDAFIDVVPFDTPYGTPLVIVRKLTPTFYNGGATVTIEFFEPEVGAVSDGGTAPTVYLSELYSETADKNNCQEGYHGSTVQLVAAAGKFTSTVSQEAANLLAINWVRENVQNYANAQGTCIINPTVYYNVKKTGSLQKNDCAVDLIGTEVTWEVPAFKYSSLISQADADAQAQAEIDANLTQAYANAQGSCVMQYYNTELVFTRQKDSCPANYTGEVLKLTVPANTYSSLISQADADNKALAYAQLQLSQAVANATGKCITNCTLTLTKYEYFTQVSTQGIKRFYKINGPLNVGDTFTLLVYGMKASYTVQIGDSISDVVVKWVNVIRSKDVAYWDTENMYPNSSNTVYLPKANAHPIFPPGNWDTIEIKMASSINFQVFIE